MKWTSYNQQRAERNLDADIQRTKKHIFYCNLIIAACSGASVVLSGVLFHLAAN